MRLCPRRWFCSDRSIRVRMASGVHCTKCSKSAGVSTGNGGIVGIGEESEVGEEGDDRDGDWSCTGGEGLLEEEMLSNAVHVGEGGNVSVSSEYLGESGVFGGEGGDAFGVGIEAGEVCCDGLEPERGRAIVDDEGLGFSLGNGAGFG